MDSRSVYGLSGFLTSGIPLGAGIGKRPVDHLIVAPFIYADIVPARAIYFVSIGRTVAVIPDDPFLVTSQQFSFADLVISPELFPAGGTPQHEHIETLLLQIFECVNHHCSRFKYYK